MTSVKITKRVVDSALPKDKRYKVFDSLIIGFGVLVTPTGSKSYIYEYRPGEGGRGRSKSRYTIGKSTELTADQARREAERLRAMVATGGDPMGSKSDARAALTVEEIANRWLSSHVKLKRADGTFKHYQDLLNRFINPAIGKLKAETLHPSKVAKLHRDCAATPYQANRILACISALYTWAGKESNGLVPWDLNPARGIEKYQEPSRERPLTSEELARLAEALHVAETTGIPWVIDKPGSKHLAEIDKRVTIINPHVATAIRLLIFTGARVGEVLNLEWKQVDLTNAVLTLDRHKTQRLTGRKTIVLNEVALDLLLNLERVGRYVIASPSAGSANERPRRDIKKPWASITRHARLDDLQLKDLRHNFATFGVAGGQGLPIVGKLLGHTKASTTERYAHVMIDPQRRATQAIADELTRITGMKGTKAMKTESP